MPKEEVLAFLQKHKKLGFVLVESSGEIVYGNLEKFVTLTWLHYKENATIPNINKNINTKKDKVSNLINTGC